MLPETSDPALSRGRPLQECEAELAGKAALISRLQARSCEVGRLLSSLQMLGVPAGDSGGSAPRPPRRRGGMKTSRSAHVIGEVRTGGAGVCGTAGAPVPEEAAVMSSGGAGGVEAGDGSAGNDVGGNVGKRRQRPRHLSTFPPPAALPMVTSSITTLTPYMPDVTSPGSGAPEGSPEDVSAGIANTRLEQECGLTPDTPFSGESRNCESSMEGWETIDGDEI